MILYFANRKMQVLGHASTHLPEGFVVHEDLKTEDVETGISSFSCRVSFYGENRSELESMAEAGNFILRKNESETEFYTIIEAEIDTKEQDIYIYAEDAGLDLLNEIVGEYEATEAKTAAWYFEKYIYDSGFEIGVNEIPESSTRKLSWDGESTAAERVASIATQFGNYEISYSFDIVGMEITHKYLNIYKERGKDVGEPLYLNRDIDRIITKKTIANLATALKCKGGTPEKSDKPITLKGYEYDDGDFYVSGDLLKSRNALAKWSRYQWEGMQTDSQGHIVQQYSYDTTSQKTLCEHAITELKKICDLEINYEAEINRLPEGVKVGDRINIIDDAGELYLSTRILFLETSVCDRTQKATLGEYLIKSSGISSMVQELALQFAESAAENKKALEEAAAAQAAAEEAKTHAETAAASATEAKTSIETLEIGGRNLYIGSSDFSSGDWTNIEEYTEDGTDSFGNVVLTKTNAWLGLFQEIQAKAGESYTLSVNAKGDGTAKLWFYVSEVLEDGTENTHGVKDYGVCPTTETRFAETWEVRNDCILRFRVENSKAGYNLWVSSIKLEKGNKATDWTPAPEDVQEGIDNAQNAADTAQLDVDVTKGDVEQINAIISELVTSGSAESILVETENGGWSFNMAAFTNADAAVKDQITQLLTDVADGQKDIGELQTGLNNIGVKTDYINIGTYEGKPCIELGENDSEFKLRITNTSIQFVSGSDVPAYIANTEETSKLMIEQAEVLNELQQGGFVWKTRENGNLGLVWKGVS